MKRKEPRSDEVVGLALAAAAAVAFGTLAISAKLAYDDGADVVPLLAIRFGTGALLLALFHLVRRRSLRIPAGVAVRLMMLGAFGYAFESSLFFIALEHAPAGVVSLIFYSYPLWTLLFAIALRSEKADRFVWGALLMGSAGVATIFSVEATGLRGPLFALAAAVAVAVYMLVAQATTPGIEPTTSATYTALGATLVLGAVLLFGEHSFPVDALPEAGALGLATAFSFVGLYGAIALIGPSRTAIANMVEPVTTVILAALILDERITFRIGVGALLVLAALPILARGARRGRLDPV